MSLRPIALTLSLLLLAVAPVSAAPAEDPAKGSERAALEQLKGDALQLKNKLQQSPTDADTRLKLGLLLLQLGDGRGAEKELAMVAAPLPAAETAISLAQARLLSGNYAALVSGDAADSIAEIEAISGLSPEQRAALKGLHGQAFLALDRVTDAQQMFDSGAEDDADEPQVRLGQVLVARRTLSLDEVALELARLRDGHPEFAPGWSLSGDIESARGNQEAAMVFYTKALALQPNRARDRFNRALARVALDDLDGAAVDAENLQVAGSAAGAELVLGLLAYKQGNLDSAQTHFNEVLSVEDANPIALYYGALAAAGQGHLEQARAQLGRFTSRFPSNVNGLVALALVTAVQGDLGNARLLLDSALSIDPDSRAALDLLGRVEFTSGQPQDASVTFGRLAELAPDSAEAMLKLGAALGAAGKGDEARALVAKSLKAPSSDDLAPEVRIRALLVDQQPDAALTAAESFVQSKPTALAFFTLGQVHQSRGEFDQSKAAYQRALAIEPANPVVLEALGRLLLTQGAPQDAEPLLRQLVDVRPQDLGATLAWVQSLARLGQTPAAEKALLAAASRHPEAWQPRVLLARHYRSMGQPDKGIALLSELGDFGMDNPVVVEELGQSRLVAKQPDQALELMGRLVALAPRSARAHYELAEVQAALGNLDDARRSLEEALTLEPEFAEPQIVLARMALAGNDPDTAGALVSQLTRIQPTNPDVQSLVAVLAVRRGDYQSAVTAYQSALQQAPTGDLAVALAMTQMGAGDPDGAIATLQRWLKDHPQDHDARLSLGNLGLVAKRLDLAKAQFKALIDAGAGTASAHNNLAQILLSEKNLDGALVNSKHAIELAPQDPRLRDALGLNFLARADYPRALEAFDQGLALAPDDPGLGFHRAVALVSLGRRDEALEALNKILGGDPQFGELNMAQELRDRLKTEAGQAPAAGK